MPFLGFLTAAVLAWYFYNKARHQERMALIEKGEDLSRFYANKPAFKFPWRNIGIVLVGIILGLVSYILLYLSFPNVDLLEDIAGPGFIAMGVLFGALAMLLVARLEKKVINKREDG